MQNKLAQIQYAKQALADEYLQKQAELDEMITKLSSETIEKKADAADWYWPAILAAIVGGGGGAVLGSGIGGSIGGGIGGPSEGGAVAGGLLGAGLGGLAGYNLYDILNQNITQHPEMYGAMSTPITSTAPIKTKEAALAEQALLALGINPYINKKADLGYDMFGHDTPWTIDTPNEEAALGGAVAAGPLAPLGALSGLINRNIGEAWGADTVPGQTAAGGATISGGLGGLVGLLGGIAGGIEAGGPSGKIPAAVLLGLLGAGTLGGLGAGVGGLGGYLQGTIGHGLRD